jgi:hypothetical protein
MIIKILDKKTNQEKNINELKNLDLIIFNCDNCNKKFIRRHKPQKNNILERHLCSSCKFKKTSLERYGVENPGQSKIVKNKIKETFSRNYEEGHPLKNKKIRNKIKSTNIEKYGVENPGQSLEIKKKIKILL